MKGQTNIFFLGLMRIRFIFGSVNTTHLPSENVVHTLLNTKNYRDKMNYLGAVTDIKFDTIFTNIFSLIFQVQKKCKATFLALTQL